MMTPFNVHNHKQTHNFKFNKYIYKCWQSNNLKYYVSWFKLQIEMEIFLGLSIILMKLKASVLT